MKVHIEFSCDNDAFQKGFMWDEVEHVLSQALEKLMRQEDRPPCLCNHAEAADKLLDRSGNTIGTVKLVKDED